MRTLNLLNRDVAGAACPDGFAAAGGLLATDVLAGFMPGFMSGFMPGSVVGFVIALGTEVAGRFGGRAIEAVLVAGRAAIRGGRSAVGLKAGSVAADATFSAVVFSDEAKATVSSHVGGRVTTGAAAGGLVAGADFAGVEICCAEIGGTDV